MTRDFHGEISVALAETSNPVERSGAWASLRERQRAWLKKQMHGKKAVWRPQTRHRIGALRNVQYLDHQLKIAGIPEGLHYFMHKGDTHWSLQPHLSISWDQDSINMSAGHFFWYKAGLNCDITWDYSHGAWNDVKCAAKDVGAMPFLLSMLLVWNLPHGPWGSDMRSSQVYDMLKEWWAKPYPEVRVLFQAYAYDILFDLGREQRAGDVHIVSELWDEFRNSNPFVKKGCKTNLNRFMSLVMQGKKEAKYWTMRRVVYESCCLENDELKGKFVDAMIKVANPGVHAEKASTSSKKMDAVDVAVHKSAANTMAVAVHVLSKPHNRRRLHMFLEASIPVQLWHAAQNKNLRSAPATLEWLLNATVGDECMKHMCRLWAGVSLGPALLRQGFWLHQPDGPPPSEECLVVEDAFANEAGSWCLAMLYRRLCRCLPLLEGWPNSTVRMLGDAATANKEIDRFERDIKNFDFLCACADSTPGVETIVQRHLFQRKTNRQIIEAFKESEFNITDSIKAHLTQRFSKVTSTQVVEDSFNYTKNDAQLLRRKRLGRPEKAAAVLMSRRILSKVHHYKEVVPDSSPLLRGISAPNSFFLMHAKDCKFPVQDLSGTKQDCSWFSPNADRSSVPIADLRLVDAATSRKQLHMLRFSWLGGLARWQHNIVLKISDVEGSGAGWAFALGPVGDSAVLAWPAKEVELVHGDPARTFFQPVVPLSRPLFVAILDLQSWEGCSYEWHAPAWTHSEHPDSKYQTRLLAVRRSPTLPLLSLAAEEAFWDLPLTTLQALSAHVGLAHGAALDAFDLVLSLLKHACPNKEEVDLLPLVIKRLAVMKKNAGGDVINEVLAVDETADYLTKDDHANLKKEASKMQGREIDYKAFKERYKTKKAELSPPIVQPKKRSRKREASAAQRLRVPEDGTIPHVEAKALAPPGSHLWIARGDQTWNGRYPPFSSHSRSWHRYGERDALILVLRAVWEDYCDAHGMDTSEVPVQGLFGHEGSASSAL